MVFRILILLAFYCEASSQVHNNSMVNKLTHEKKTFYSYKKKRSTTLNNFAFNQLFTLNNGIPNLENRNGIYAPKGALSSTSLFFGFNAAQIKFSAEPTITKFDNYKSENIYENTAFKYSNSTFTSLDEIMLKNSKIHFLYKEFTIGYENVPHWWGPGLHNSLIMTNNADGLPNYFIKIKNNELPFIDIGYEIKLFSTNSIKNEYGNNYYISSIQAIFTYENLELGIAKLIFSGGYDNINWSFKKALKSLILNRKLENKDIVSDIYVSYLFPASKIKFFADFGILNTNKEYRFYRNNTLASIIGMRKYGALGIENLSFGIEYTKLVQSPYYDKIPTPNWYDNTIYNHSTFNERIIGAHGGTDSDDLLLYLGIIDDKKSAIIAFNYERHGITYNFPPEVKLERKIIVNYLFSNLSLQIEYESEHFRHYGFIDSNQNIWNEEFENGSIKNSKTLLLYLSYKLF